MSQRTVSNMKVGIVAFLLGLALIHKSVAETVEADSEKPDDTDPLPLLDGEVPDGMLFVEGDKLVNLTENFTSDYSKLLEHVAIITKNCTPEECQLFRQCNKFGEHVICISFFIFDSEEFFSKDHEEDHEHGIGNDNEDVDDAEEEAQDDKGEAEDNQDEKAEEA